MRRLLYLIGVPGSGKTTLMRALVAGQRRRVRSDPFTHTVYLDSGLVQLGRERESFGGTDCLSMSVSPRAKAALDAQLWTRIVGEGDRLSNAGFFDAAKAAGYELEVVLLDCNPEVAAARRFERGTQQSESWARGRATKIDNLRPYVTRTLDATDAIESLVAQLSDHPVFTGA